MVPFAALLLMPVALPLQAVSTASIVACEMAMGDVIEQQLEHRHCGLSWDRARSMRLGLTGFITTGPLAHMLFQTLERLSPGTSPAAVLSKVAMNAAFMPAMISATLGTAWALEGQAPGSIVSQLRHDLVPAVTAGLAFWPLANILVYACAPPPMRPAVSSGFGGLWDIYLSACANHDGARA